MVARFEYVLAWVSFVMVVDWVIVRPRQRVRYQVVEFGVDGFGFGFGFRPIRRFDGWNS